MARKKECNDKKVPNFTLDTEIDKIEIRVKNLESSVNALSDYVYSKDYTGKGKLVKCNKCGNSWKYKGKYITCTCPNCKGTINVDDCIVGGS